ncbi:MAG TPA: ABC transporter substrate-binding protein [Actinomycetota bacterium]|nr:ABC transporter substrate-binding protein [Actinomycetota bacterium]
MRRLVAVAAVGSLLTLAACETREPALRVGAVYPLSGTQGPGGIEEYRGVEVAAELANEDGGVHGRGIQLVPVDVPGGDAAPGAIADLADRGVEIVLGSYGSTISAPAAEAAAGRGMVFWETGAVGEMTGAAAGELVFRFAPTGAVLGRNAIEFVADRYAPLLGRDPAELRYAVTLVDDAYGRAVARGALDELRARGYVLAAELAYDPRRVDMEQLVSELAATDPDVVFVSAYLEDAVAMRREMVAQGLDLLAGIGTSSSYCMPQFGAELGEEAVGLFASDKPDQGALDPSGLTPEGRALLERAGDAYAERFGEPMSAAALAGFSAAWALFAEVLPGADRLDAAAVARAANATDLPEGSLPNGSGLRFGPTGSATAGDNVLASSLIWQWQSARAPSAVWPPRFATRPIERIDPLP